MIVALLSRKLRGRLLALLLAPVAAWALERAGERVAERRGEADRGTRVLRYASERVRRKTRPSRLARVARSRRAAKRWDPGWR